MDGPSSPIGVSTAPKAGTVASRIQALRQLEEATRAREISTRQTPTKRSPSQSTAKALVGMAGPICNVPFPSQTETQNARLGHCSVLGSQQPLFGATLSSVRATSRLISESSAFRSGRGRRMTLQIQSPAGPRTSTPHDHHSGPNSPSTQKPGIIMKDACTQTSRTSLRNDDAMPPWALDKRKNHVDPGMCPDCMREATANEWYIGHNGKSITDLFKINSTKVGGSRPRVASLLCTHGTPHRRLQSAMDRYAYAASPQDDIKSIHSAPVCSGQVLYSNMPCHRRRPMFEVRRSSWSSVASLKQTIECPESPWPTSPITDSKSAKERERVSIILNGIIVKHSDVLRETALKLCEELNGLSEDLVNAEISLPPAQYPEPHRSIKQEMGLVQAHSHSLAVLIEMVKSTTTAWKGSFSSGSSLDDAIEQRQRARSLSPPPIGVPLPLHTPARTRSLSAGDRAVKHTDEAASAPLTPPDTPAAETSPRHQRTRSHSSANSNPSIKALPWTLNGIGPPEGMTVALDGHPPSLRQFLADYARPLLANETSVTLVEAVADGESQRQRRLRRRGLGSSRARTVASGRVGRFEAQASTVSPAVITF